MENKSHALAAGIFVIALTLAVAFAVAWLGGNREKTAEYVVVTKQNVTGLNPQAQVRYRGIRVGKVRDIQLDKDDVRNILIRIEVAEAVPVTRGTTAKLGFQGVTGIAHVLLEDSGKDSAPLVWSIGGEPPRIAMAPSILDELGESASGAMKQARALMEKAGVLLADDNLKHFAAALANLDASTRQLKMLLADDRVHKLGSAIARIDGAAESAQTFFRDAKLVLPRVQALSEKLERVVDGDSSAEGALAAIDKVNDLARDLSTTTRQMNRLLRSLEENPESLLLGRPKPAPGPGEPGFVVPETGRRTP